MRIRTYQQRRDRPPLRATLALFLAVLSPTLLSCAARVQEPSVVYLHVDGHDHELQTEAPTVRQALSHSEVTLGDLDRVVPPLWTPLHAGMSITVTRVEEERREQVITATVGTIRDEFLLPDESVTVKAGHDGLEELVFHIERDGAAVLGRELVDRRVLVAPREGLRLIGTKGTIPSVPVEGAIAYVANGDAWLIRGESGHKRPLTRGGRLDGRVFDLSTDGRQLLYSIVPTASAGLLNELWVLDTEVVNQTPWRLGVSNVHWAAWAPTGNRFAYATAVLSQGVPGWRANNDLSLVDLSSLEITQVLTPTTSFIYSWWGEIWAWAPDGQRLAYSHADAVGIVELEAPVRRALSTFPPFYTHGDWVWLPEMSWSPDGTRIAATVHQGDEETASFALFLLDAQGGTTVRIAEDVGPFAAPAWAPSGGLLAFGERQPGEGGGYVPRVLVADDWSQRLLVGSDDNIVATHAELGWSPSSESLVWSSNGDLYLVDLQGSEPLPLTATGLASHPRWR